MNKLLRCLRSKNGTTLVELIVCFALICIFFSGISMVLASSIQTYEKMKTMGSAQTAAELIFDQISAEVTDAALRSEKDCLRIRPDRLFVVDSTGLSVQIFADENGLLQFQSESGNWGMDSASYFGFHIQSLTFHTALSGEEEMQNYGNHILRADLTLTNGTAQFSYCRYLRFGNFSPESQRIVYQPA